jgi:hypothetical protein
MTRRYPHEESFVERFLVRVILILVALDAF